MLIKSIVIVFPILLCACTSIPSHVERSLAADQIAVQHGWSKVALETDPFTLQAFMPKSIVQADVLRIYMEGDGLAWVQPTIPSANPTPKNPLALRLALLDKKPAVYLARPCQYIADNQSKNCTQKYWTSHRFSAEVIASTHQAIDQIKQKWSAQKLILIGYSGGGAVAALVAARRNDVLKLVTVAGNLDHAYWTSQRHLSPLSGSLNPADAWMDLQKIPQQHYVGGKDTIIDKSIVQVYAAKFKISDNLGVSILPSFSHHCCWESVWPSLAESDFGQPK
jgi:Serine hydrolase (FSH1)